jgi:hypothetical protein
MDTHTILAERSRWGKAAARLGPAGRNDFRFLAALAETDMTQDGRLRQRLVAVRRANQTRGLAAVDDGE